MLAPSRLLPHLQCCCGAALKSIRKKGGGGGKELLIARERTECGFTVQGFAVCPQNWNVCVDFCCCCLE